MSVHDANRRPARPLVVLTGLALLVAACGTTTTSSQPPPSATAAPSSVEPSSPAPTSAAPTAAPSLASPATGCPIAPQTGRLPSDRLVDVVIADATGSDVVTFVFGDDSLPGPPTAPEGTLETADPPFTEGASGEPIEVDGEHVALIRFAGMSVANDVGQPVYEGEMEFRPDLPALSHVVNMEMFEGVVGWYIGYDGPGCVTLSSDGRNVSVAIDHPPS